MHVYAVLPALAGASIGAVKTYNFSQKLQGRVENPCLSAGECDEVDAYGDGEWLVITSIVWMTFNTFDLVCCLLTLHNANTGPSILERAAEESAHQALLYIIAYLSSYGWSGVEFIYQFSNSDKSQPVLYILTAIFLPLQEFWNCPLL